jgi:hypothetical protein
MSRSQRPFPFDLYIFAASEVSVLIPSTIVLNEGTPLRPLGLRREAASFRPGARKQARKPGDGPVIHLRYFAASAYRTCC